MEADGSVKFPLWDGCCCLALALVVEVEVFGFAGDSVGGTGEDDARDVLGLKAGECSVAVVAGGDTCVWFAWLGVEKGGGGVAAWRPAMELEAPPSTGSARGVTGAGESVTAEFTTHISVRVAFPMMTGQGETPTCLGS